MMVDLLVLAEQESNLDLEMAINPQTESGFNYLDFLLFSHDQS